jgi:hypothetical protein
VYVYAPTARGPVEGLIPVKWSPLAGCQDDAVVKPRVDVLVEASDQGGEQLDANHWRAGAKSILRGYFYAAAHHPVWPGDLSVVNRWVAAEEFPEPLMILKWPADEISFSGLLDGTGVAACATQNTHHHGGQVGERDERRDSQHERPDSSIPLPAQYGPRADHLSPPAASSTPRPTGCSYHVLQEFPDDAKWKQDEVEEASHRSVGAGSRRPKVTRPPVDATVVRTGTAPVSAEAPRAIRADCGGTSSSCSRVGVRRVLTCRGRWRRLRGCWCRSW